MDSVFFSIGNISIRWYSICILTAMIIASIIIRKETQKKELSKEDLIDILFYGIIIGILGARLYYVIFNWSYYWSNPQEILMIWHGGLAIHGGIIATLIFLLIYGKKKKIHTLLLLDIIVVGLLIAQSIGRWGNFFNQEAYGRIVSLEFLENLHLPKFIIQGMQIDGLYREPTFLYESIFSMLGFLILLGIRKIPKLKVGQLTGSYLIWYGIERCIIESFRSDSLMIGHYKMAQIVSFIAVLSGIYLIIKNCKREKNYAEEKLYKEKNRRTYV